MGASRPSGILGRAADPLVTLVVIAVVVMMVVPLPTVAIDLLIAANLAVSVVLLMAAAGAARPTRLATFPTILLLTTLFRLGLNVSSTRLILLQADAGRIIDAFGHAVVRGNFVVGAIVFVVITVVQYVVIARGAERVAEVGARFTLDAMPGKQLAVDADLRAGLIDHREARGRRAALEREAQLFGSMDGAMKFVKGDAIAGIVIALVSIGGGLVIGLSQRGMSAADAFQTYAILTIGDGLVTQIPALLLSTAAGLLVTRVDGDLPLGRDIARQVFAAPAPFRAAALLLVLLSLLPGLPALPFLVLAALAALASYWVGRARTDEAPRWDAPGLTAVVARDLAGLGPVLDARQQALAERLGVPLPPVELAVDPALPGGGWRLHLADVPVAAGKADAVSGLEAALTRHAHELVGVEEVTALLDQAAQRQPALVRDVTAKLPPRKLARILAGLVEERVAVRDLRTILATLVEEPSDDPELLAERCRRALRRQITHAHAGADKRLGAILFDPMVEEAIAEAVTRGERGTVLALEPDLARDIVDSVGKALASAPPGTPIVTTARARRYTRRLLETAHPDVTVLAYEELLPDVAVEEAARVSPT